MKNEIFLSAIDRPPPDKRFVYARAWKCRNGAGRSRWRQGQNVLECPKMSSNTGAWDPPQGQALAFPPTVQIIAQRDPPGLKNDASESRIRAGNGPPNTAVPGKNAYL